MRNKILILGLIFFALIACEKGIENPYSPEPELPQAKLEFYSDPYLYCPSYDPLLRYQEVRLSFKMKNNGNAIYVWSYFYIDLKLYDPTPFTLLFADVFFVDIPSGSLPIGHAMEGTLYFDVETIIWDRYVNAEDAYKVATIISADTD